MLHSHQLLTMACTVIAGLFIGAAAAASANPATAAPPLLMSGLLEKGGWEISTPKSGTAPRRICLGNIQNFVQIEHGPAPCQQYIIDNHANTLIVHYSCEGMGYGRTTIRRETNRLVQIDTQGVHNGRLFDDRYEARRAGRCGR